MCHPQKYVYLKKIILLRIEIKKQLIHDFWISSFFVLQYFDSLRIS